MHQHKQATETYTADQALHDNAAIRGVLHKVHNKCALHFCQLLHYESTEGR